MDLIEVQNRKENLSVRHPWELARLEVVRLLLKNILRNDEEFSVLDIGCGDIFFISKLADHYPKAKFYAIDIAFTDEIIAKLKAQAQGKNIFLFKTLDEASGHLKKAADLVLLLDVVEHIEDDKNFLSMLHAHEKIDKGTNIMITVPAFQSLFCTHDHFLGHYRRYTNKSLKAVTEAAGFEKKKLGYFFFLLLMPRILQVLKEKFSKPREGTTGLVEWNKGSEITNLIKNVMIFDFRCCWLLKKITGLNLPGLSNYIICKKPA